MQGGSGDSWVEDPNGTDVGISKEDTLSKDRIVYAIYSGTD